MNFVVTFLSVALLAHGSIGQRPTFSDLIYRDSASRIVGGENAGKGEYPYIASVRYKQASHRSDDSSEFKHICAASILNERTLLTSAQCTTDPRIQVQNLYIVTGTNTLRDDGGVVYQAEQLINHDEYNPNSHTNDLAIIIVSSPIKFDDSTKNIPLDEVGTSAGKQVTLIGYKHKSPENNELSNDVQYLEETIISNAECQMTWSVWDKQLCTTSPGGKGACMGDSGSPLVNEHGDLCGVVSVMGNQCANGDPVVFTKVSSYIAWIKMNTI